MRLYGHNGPLPRDPPSDGLNSAGDCEPYCTVCRARTLVVFNQKGILKQFRAVTSFRAPPNPRTNSHTSVLLPFLNASGAGSLEGEPVPLFVGLCGLDLVGWAGHRSTAAGGGIEVFGEHPTFGFVMAGELRVDASRVHKYAPIGAQLCAGTSG